MRAYRSATRGRLERPGLAPAPRRRHPVDRSSMPSRDAGCIVRPPLNTVAVYVSVLFWGWMWDVWGLLLAIPIMIAM